MVFIEDVAYDLHISKTIREKLKKDKLIIM